MVSDQEISRHVESLLRHSAPGAITSVNGVVSHLESKLGLDLSHKASFIRDQIDLLLLLRRPPPPPNDHFALHLHPHPHPHPHLPSAATYQRQLLPLAAGHAYMTHELGLRYPAPPPIQLRQQMPEVAAPNGAASVAVPSPKESAPSGVKRRGGPGGLNKVCGVSPQLQAIVGEPTMARTEIVKQLWAYIRKNNLQDPSNKRKIICNDELRLLFETDCTDMFKMNKLLAKHIIPLQPTKDSGPGSKRLKSTAAPEVVSVIKVESKENPVVISDALAEFFGTGEKEMLESEVLRRVWDYIKANNLEDPVNAVVISCDSKLQHLFRSEKISALGIQGMLARHLCK